LHWGKIRIKNNGQNEKVKVMREQDSMLEVFIYESQQLLESLEEVLLQGEKEHILTTSRLMKFSASCIR
jgi:hypothetical protein